MEAPAAGAAAAAPSAADASILRQELPKPAGMPSTSDSSRVMTEEQLSKFAEQIKQFAEISRRSIEKQKAKLDAERDRRSHKSGFRGAGAERPPGATRPRWKPTTVQISILEYIFENSDLLPGDKDITVITNGLRLYGPVEEVNVFYWFQNRRARAKRTAATAATTTTTTTTASGATATTASGSGSGAAT